MEWYEWTETPSAKHVVYRWGGRSFVLGFGRSHIANGNDRVNPGVKFKDIKSKKDGGKTFYGLFAAKLLNDPLKLYWTPDNSIKTSENTSELEVQMREQYLGKAFINFNGTKYRKVEFADQIVVPAIAEKFGENSLEHIIATNCAGDGDLWGRVSRHPKSAEALQRIMEEFLWVDQSTKMS